MGLGCTAQTKCLSLRPLYESGCDSVIEISEKGGKEEAYRRLGLGLKSVFALSSSSSFLLLRDCSFCVTEKEEIDPSKWRWLSTSSEGRS